MLGIRSPAELASDFDVCAMPVLADLLENGKSSIIWTLKHFCNSAGVKGDAEKPVHVGGTMPRGLEDSEDEASHTGNRMQPRSQETLQCDVNGGNFQATMRRQPNISCSTAPEK